MSCREARKREREGERVAVAALHYGARTWQTAPSMPLPISIKRLRLHTKGALGLKLAGKAAPLSAADCQAEPVASPLGQDTAR